MAWYINDSRHNNITIREGMCSNNIEMLSISLLTEGVMFATVSYISPDADQNIALNAFCENANALISSLPDALHILYFNDANRCVQDLSNALHG